MATFDFLLLLVAAVLVRFSCASHPNFDVAVRTHNAPGGSDAETYSALQHSLASLRRREDQSSLFKTDISRQKGWESAVLLFLADQLNGDDNYNDTSPEPSVEIVCDKCYINALATAELKFSPGFDINQAINETFDEVRNEVSDIWNATQEWVEDFFGEAAEDLLALDFDNFTLPPFNVSLDVDVKRTQEASLHFNFEEFELLMQVRTKLPAGSEFTIPLLESSPNPLPGVDFEFDVFFTADLILSFDQALEVTSGIHLKLDQGVSFAIDLFGNNPSDISINGGQFEFLPVTIGAGGAAFPATLRVGTHAGLNIGVEGLIEAGVEVAVFADVAKIVTNITATPDDVVCMPMSQEYSFDLGARVGATMAFQSTTLGPVAETFTPLWYTTKTDMCASKAASTAALSSTPSSSALGRRDDLQTTTATTEITHTGISCPQSLGPNCPLSLRSTTKYTETRRLTTAVPSGEVATFPVSTYDTVTTEAFGSNVQKISSSSGSPVSYIQPTSTFKGDPSAGDDQKGSGSHGATCSVALSFTSTLLVVVLIGAFAL